MSDWSDTEKTIRILNDEASKRVIIRKGWSLRDEIEYRKTDAFKNSFEGKGYKIACAIEEMKSKIFKELEGNKFFAWLAKIWLK